MDTFTYKRGAEDPPIVLPWKEELTAGVWTDLPLAGYTFSLTLTPLKSTTATVTKTAGITGSTGSARIVWTIGELDIVEATYLAELRATSSSRDRDYQPFQVEIT